MTLKADIISDLTTFLNSNEFAASITYNSATIKGIFDDAYKGINLATGEIESTNPQVIVRASGISGLEHGATLIINSITYYVTGIHTDGTGLTTLLLSRDAP